MLVLALIGQRQRMAIDIMPRSTDKGIRIATIGRISRVESLRFISHLH